MLTRDENELLTQVSRGTPCGELLRLPELPNQQENIYHGGAGREKKSLFAKISSCKYLISFMQNLQF
jgi:hypothetical protein